MPTENPRKIIVDCYDAYGFYEENYQRIMLIMEKLNNGKLLKREWASAQAVGGSWARSIRCVFETEVDIRTIKKQMIGLEYCSVEEVPESLRDASSEVFRFADIDVINVDGDAGSLGRLKHRITGRKIESADVLEQKTKKDLILTCRSDLLASLTPELKDNLLSIEHKIIERITTIK